MHILLLFITLFTSLPIINADGCATLYEVLTHKQPPSQRIFRTDTWANDIMPFKFGALWKTSDPLGCCKGSWKKYVKCEKDKIVSL